MSVRLILGRAGTGKTYRCLEEIRAAMQEDPFGPPLILLVPEQATFQMEQALVAQGKVTGTARAQVLSFQRLAQRVFSEVGGRARSRLGEVGKRMLLRSLLHRRRDDLELFVHSVGQAGFVERLAATLTELRTYGYSPEQVRQMAAELPEDQRPVLAPKLRDLALLYEDYVKYIANRYADPVNILAEAAHLLHHADLLAGAHVWIDGFAGFTPQEYKMLAAVFRRSERVTVALCLDPEAADLSFREPPSDDFGLFRLAYETAREIAAMCRQSGVTLERPEILTPERPPRFRSDALAHLEQQWEKYPPLPWTGDTSAVQLISAEDRLTEVEAVASEINRLVRTEGYRFRDISVIVRNLDTYAPYISRVFRIHRIPFFLDQRRPMLFHPLIRAVTAALDAIASRWDSGVVIRYLKTDLTQIDRDDVDRLENYVLEHGITGWAWADERPWDYGRYLLRDEEEEVSTPERPAVDFDRIRRRAMAPLLRLASVVGRGRTFGAAEAAAALWAFLVDIEAAAKVRAWIAAAEKEGDAELASLHTQVWDAVVDLLEQMANVLPQDPLDLDELIAMLSEGFAGLRLGLIPPTADQVLVGAIDRSRQPDIRAAFALGLVDREFPAVPQEDVVLTDDDREALAGIGVALSETSRARLDHEMYYAYIALTRPSERLTLSAPRSDGSGRALVPSTIIDRVRRLLPDAPVRQAVRADLGQDLERAVTPERAISCVVSGLRANPSSERLLDAYEWLVTHSDFGPRVKPILRSLAYTNVVAPLPADLAAALYGEPMVTSVSRLERFARCPFQHFAADGLRLRERSILRLDPSRLGMLIHSVLKAYIDELLSSGGDWADVTDDEAIEWVDRLTLEIAGELAGEALLSSARQRYIVDSVRRTLHTAVRIISEHAQVSRFRPYATEVGFGRPSDELPSWRLHLTDGGVAELVGIIDRMDRARIDGIDYVRVIDYKSYKRRIAWADVLAGLELQLFVYLAVATEHQGMVPAGAFYAPVRDPYVDADADVDDETAWDLRLAECRAEGVLLQDEDATVALHMDGSVEPKSRSKLLPFGLTKDGAFHANSNVVSLEEMTLALERVRRIATELAERIRAGEHTARPFRRPNMRRACDTCPYHAVCRFDILIEGSEYNHIGTMKLAEFRRSLREAGDGAEDTEEAV